MSVDYTGVTSQYLYQDPVDPAGSTLTIQELYSCNRAADYAVVEHKGDTSQLQLWAYEVANDNLTLAERLEREKWETERLEKL